MLVILNLPLVGHVGEAAEDTLPVAVPRDHHVLRGRQLLDQQQRHGRVLCAIAGILGYMLVKLECEPAPLILGYVLGPLMEENLRRALLISRGDPTVFFTRPISLAFMIVEHAHSAHHDPARDPQEEGKGVRRRRLITPIARISALALGDTARGPPCRARGGARAAPLR